MLNLILIAIKNPKFATRTHSEFAKTLRKRVNQYFKNNNITKHANASMISKTVVMLVLFFGPLVILNTGIVNSIWLLFLLYALSGIGMAGIGMCVMHDANHGSYSKNPRVNKMLGYALNLIGANAKVWKIQHNVLHHTYTNIEESDEDINVPLFLRFTPHAKRYWIHRFQHWYAWFFYGISTFFWVVSKDFTSLTRYKKLGLLKANSSFPLELMKVAGWKLLYFSYAIIIPLIVLPLSPWAVLLAFLTMHFLVGLIITSIFQVAHVMPNTKFPLPNEDGLVAGDWYSHQMATTSNFAPKSRLFSWFIGGLNYQVEHHLLPHICHVHYRKLSVIVANTAREYGIPYNTKRTFIGALYDHFKLLRNLGKA